jgi:hypothetical protein
MIGIATSKVSIKNNINPFREECKVTFDSKNRMVLKYHNVDNFFVRNNEEVIVISCSDYCYKDGLFYIVQRGKNKFIMDENELTMQKEKGILDD